MWLTYFLKISPEADDRMKPYGKEMRGEERVKELQAKKLGVLNE
jgi:hypothetical protein